MGGDIDVVEHVLMNSLRDFISLFTEIFNRATSGRVSFIRAYHHSKLFMGDLSRMSELRYFDDVSPTR